MSRLFKLTSCLPAFLSSISIFCLCFGWGVTLAAQVPEWQRLYGGSSREWNAFHIRTTSDGGAAAVCLTYSNNGDVMEQQGGGDIWIVKVNSLGQVQWQQNIGGSSKDEAYGFINTIDGGFMLVGRTASEEFLGHTLDGSQEAFVVKLNSLGDVEWSRVFGGPEEEVATDIVQTPQGDYLITLASSSESEGNLLAYCAAEPGVSGQKLSVLKLDQAGNPVWQNCIGGTGWDSTPEIEVTPAGEIIFAMKTRSTDGDIDVNYGDFDLWVAKMDSLGNILWQRTLGGSDVDWLGSMALLEDGRVVVAGASQSDNYDLADNEQLSENMGWVACLDASGNLLWDKSYGGSSDQDYFHDIQPFGDKLLVVGYTNSVDGDLEFSYGGGADGWAIVIDADSGALLLSEVYGGSDLEIIYSASVSEEGFIFFSGASKSDDNQVHSNHGHYDLWLGKLSAGFNTVCGSVHYDVNSNGAVDSVDWPLPNLLITSQNGNQSFATHTGSSGIFSIPVSVDSVTTTFFNPFPLFSVVPDTEQVSLFPGLYEKDTVRFFLTAEGEVPDIEVSFFPVSVPRPGFPLSYQLQVCNAGNTILEDSLFFEFPPEQLLYLDNDGGGVFTPPSKVSFFVGELPPFQCESVQLDFQVKLLPEVSLGDTLSVSFIADSIPGEPLLYNNIYDVQQVIVGAYDPNDKTVLNRDSLNTETLTADSVFLDYLIRFQNTGTDTAFNVVVRDTLDARLDGHTFQLLDASHPMEGTMRDGRYLRFDFRNILLPDSTTNEPESHGYILYRIRPKSGLVAGDRVENTAHIYFDFNPPIVTNTVATVVYDPIPSGLRPGFGSNSTEPLALYPNPTAGQLFFQLPAKERGQFSYQILTTGGKVMAGGWELLTATGRGELTVAGLPAGAYLLRVLNEGKTYTGIFIRN